MSELKPCPFCGLALVRDQLSDGMSRWTHPPRKSTDDAYCPTFNYIVYSDEPKSIDAWNSRAPAPTVGDDLAPERLASLRDEFAGLQGEVSEGGMPDGHGAVSAFYTSLSIAEVVALIEAATALATLRERVARLETALKPFADAYRKNNDPGVSDLYDEQPMAWHVQLGAWRRARRTLRGE